MYRKINVKKQENCQNKILTNSSWGIRIRKGKNIKVYRSQYETNNNTKKHNKKLTIKWSKIKYNINNTINEGYMKLLWEPNKIIHSKLNTNKPMRSVYLNNNSILNEELCEEVKLYTHGAQQFHDQWTSIDEAQNEICIEAYQLGNDFTGKYTQERLCAAAKRNVNVIQLYDAFGSSSLGTGISLQPLVECGGIVISYNYYIQGNKWYGNPFHRNHRKNCIIDGYISYTGGMNYTNDYNSRDDTEGKSFRDTQLRLSSKAVASQLRKQFFDSIREYIYKTSSTFNLSESFILRFLWLLHGVPLKNILSIYKISADVIKSIVDTDILKRLPSSSSSLYKLTIDNLHPRQKYPIQKSFYEDGLRVWKVRRRWEYTKVLQNYIKISKYKYCNDTIDNNNNILRNINKFYKLPMYKKKYIQNRRRTLIEYYGFQHPIGFPHRTISTGAVPWNKNNFIRKVGIHLLSIFFNTIFARHLFNELKGSKKLLLNDSNNKGVYMRNINTVYKIKNKNINGSQKNSQMNIYNTKKILLTKKIKKNTNNNINNNKSKLQISNVQRNRKIYKLNKTTALYDDGDIQRCKNKNIWKKCKKVWEKGMHKQYRETMLLFHDLFNQQYSTICDGNQISRQEFNYDMLIGKREYIKDTSNKIYKNKLYIWQNKRVNTASEWLYKRQYYKLSMIKPSIIGIKRTKKSNNTTDIVISSPPLPPPLPTKSSSLSSPLPSPSSSKRKPKWLKDIENILNEYIKPNETKNILIDQTWKGRLGQQSSMQNIFIVRYQKHLLKDKSYSYMYRQKYFLKHFLHTLRTRRSELIVKEFLNKTITYKDRLKFTILRQWYRVLSNNDISIDQYSGVIYGGRFIRSLHRIRYKDYTVIKRQRLLTRFNKVRMMIQDNDDIIKKNKLLNSSMVLEGDTNNIIQNTELLNQPIVPENNEITEVFNPSILKNLLQSWEDKNKIQEETLYKDELVKNTTLLKSQEEEQLESLGNKRKYHQNQYIRQQKSVQHIRNRVQLMRFKYSIKEQYRKKLEKWAGGSDRILIEEQSLPVLYIQDKISSTETLLDPQKHLLNEYNNDTTFTTYNTAAWLPYELLKLLFNGPYIILDRIISPQNKNVMEKIIFDRYQIINCKEIEGNKSKDIDINTPPLQLNRNYIPRRYNTYITSIVNRCIQPLLYTKNSTKKPININKQINELLNEKISKSSFTFSNTYIHVQESKPSLRCNSKRSIQYFYKYILRSAKNTIIISNPYIFPSKWYEKEIWKALSRGVKISIITGNPYVSDLQVSGLAFRHLYYRYITSGIRIFEYQERTLHMKSLIIDGKISCIGSYNLDPLSNAMNLETCIGLRSTPSVASILNAKSILDISRSIEFTKSSINIWTLRERFIYFLAYKWCEMYYYLIQCHPLYKCKIFLYIVYNFIRALIYKRSSIHIVKDGLLWKKPLHILSLKNSRRRSYILLYNKYMYVYVFRIDTILPKWLKNFIRFFKKRIGY